MKKMGRDEGRLSKICKNDFTNLIEPCPALPALPPNWQTTTSLPIYFRHASSESSGPWFQTAPLPGTSFDIRGFISRNTIQLAVKYGHVAHWHGGGDSYRVEHS